MNAEAEYETGTEKHGAGLKKHDIYSRISDTQLDRVDEGSLY